MRSTLLQTAFALGCSASILPRHESNKCYFTLYAHGGASGTIGQLADGQCRIGGGYTPSKYYLQDGGIYDVKGRGCILTPPTGQWQCDEGAQPTKGAFIKKDGCVGYHGSTQFWACPVNDFGEWNIYDRPLDGQPKCVQISVDTQDNCPAEIVVSPIHPPPKPEPRPYHDGGWKPVPGFLDCDCKLDHCPKKCDEPPTLPPKPHWHPKPPPKHENHCEEDDDEECYDDGWKPEGKPSSKSHGYSEGFDDNDYDSYESYSPVLRKRCDEGDIECYNTEEPEWSHYHPYWDSNDNDCACDPPMCPKKCRKEFEFTKTFDAVETRTKTFTKAFTKVFTKTFHHPNVKTYKGEVVSNCGEKPCAQPTPTHGWYPPYPYPQPPNWGQTGAYPQQGPYPGPGGPKPYPGGPKPTPRPGGYGDSGYGGGYDYGKPGNYGHQQHGQSGRSGKSHKGGKKPHRGGKVGKKEKGGK